MGLAWEWSPSLSQEFCYYNILSLLRSSYSSEVAWVPADPEKGCSDAVLQCQMWYSHRDGESSASAIKVIWRGCT